MRSNGAEVSAFDIYGMKTLAFATALIIMVSMTSSAQTRPKEAVLVGMGKQKTAKKSGLKIKFLEVIEDSRCPTGVDCIWAGNAKVKVQIIGAVRSQIFEFNTNIGPQGDVFDGWSIRMTELTPAPVADKPLDTKTYKAKFTITRPSR